MEKKDIWWDKFRINNLNKIIKIMTTEEELKDLVVQVREVELIKKQKQIDNLKGLISHEKYPNEITKHNQIHNACSNNILKFIDKVFEVKK